MPRFGLLLLVFGLLLAAPLAPARAEDKPKAKAVKKPVGTWVRKVDETTLTFVIKEDGMTITVKDGNGGTLEIEADYGVTKDGVLYGCMTKVTKKNIDPPTDKGDLFSIAFSISGKELTVSDLKGTHANDDARKLVEGVYQKQ